MKRNALVLLSFVFAISACTKNAPVQPEAPSKTPEQVVQAGDAAKDTPAEPPVVENLTKAPEGAKVFFVNLKDGQTIPAAGYVVKFGVSGMKVLPAGNMAIATGHHHLLIDVDGTDAGTVVPADDNHIHFGKGQTETEVKLKPGPHRLTLQFANGAHQSYGEPMRATVNVVAK